LGDASKESCMADNFQREGSESNAHVGRAFEKLAKEVLNSSGIPVVENHAADVGIENRLKSHQFVGCEDPPVLVECKSHC
jgi:hypothetical protein